MSKKYSIYDKKKIMYNIKKIDEKELYDDIYSVINGHVEFTKNSNGVFFDFNKLSNEVLEIIEELVFQYKISETEEQPIEFIKYSTEEFDKLDIKGSRLNNIEKQFLKFNKKNKTK
tara:strand:+ start:883 stop:1230 length:348 start_codon:yes stop_codon:yes gene_type:complete